MLSQHSGLALKTSSLGTIIPRWGAKITGERLLDKAKLQRADETKLWQKPHGITTTKTSFSSDKTSLMRLIHLGKWMYKYFQTLRIGSWSICKSCTEDSKLVKRFVRKVWWRWKNSSQMIYRYKLWICGGPWQMLAAFCEFHLKSRYSCCWGNWYFLIIVSRCWNCVFPLYKTWQKLHVAAIRRGLGNDGSGYEARIRVLKLIRRRPWEKCDRSEMGVVWGNLTDVTIAVRFYIFWKNGIEKMMADSVIPNGKSIAVNWNYEQRLRNWERVGQKELVRKYVMELEGEPEPGPGQYFCQ